MNDSVIARTDSNIQQYILFILMIYFLRVIKEDFLFKAQKL